MNRPFPALLLATTLALSLGTATARAHDEPPKTMAEYRDQAERRQLFASLGVSEQHMFVTRPGVEGGAESLYLSNTFDRDGNHLEQVVVDPAQAQRSVSRYAPDGTWLAEETWREGKLSERTTFISDADGLVRRIVSEDLEGGTRDELTYETAPQRDEIVVTKTGATGESLYVIRYRYEPGSGLERLAEAIQSEADGKLRTRTRQSYDGKRRRTKEVFGADGAPAWTFTYEYTPDGDFAHITRRGPDGAVASSQVYTYRPDRLPLAVSDRDASGTVTREMRYEYRFFTPEPAGH
ncbi:MAG: hypothetical protein IPG61_08525 [bacterium]|nr:hypothetical protein [bacterium]